MMSLEEIIKCNSIGEFGNIARKRNISFFWQKHTPEIAHVYDKMPNGFFDVFYGTDLDLRCPVAWAFRSRIWPVFSFEQARGDRRFNQMDLKQEAKELWEKNNSKDGLMVLSGRPGLDSFAVFTFEQKIENIQKEALPFIALTHKLDDWLEHRTDLIRFERKFSSLSPKETDTLKVQIKYPHLSIKEQASELGISELTLATRHERIAKKFGVKRFAGAALLAERTHFFSVQ